MEVVFHSDSILSIIDLTTFGGSEKANDDSKIGQFCSGLKYAISILYRNNVSIKIQTKHENNGVITTSIFEPFVTTKVDDINNKKKEIISFNVNTIIESLGEVTNTRTVVESGISTQLGLDWELRFALRELYSNMIDEGGHYVENTPITDSFGTQIKLTFDGSEGFGLVWNNRYDIFIKPDLEPIYVFKEDKENIDFFGYSSELHRIELYGNDDNYFKVFKKGILVYEVKTQETQPYSFNINFGQLDERRVLLDFYMVSYDIRRKMIYSLTDPNNFEFMSNNLGSSLLSDAIDVGISDEFIEYVKGLDRDVKTFPFLLAMLRKSPKSPLDNRMVKKISSGIYNYDREITIKETISDIETIEDNKTIEEAIKQKYGIEVGYPIKEATIKGSVVVGDKYNKLILIDGKFDVDDESHIASLLVQLVDFDGKGNIIEKLSMELVKQYKKNK